MSAFAIGRPIERWEVTRRKQTAISSPPFPPAGQQLLLELPAIGAIDGGGTKDCAYRKDVRHPCLNI